MMSKVQNMCTANDVKFDLSVFNTAKSIAVNASVTGVSSDGKSFGGVATTFGIDRTGHHSSSTLDMRTLVDGFTQTFKESYTQWVDKEKEKANSKS